MISVSPASMVQHAYTLFAYHDVAWRNWDETRSVDTLYTVLLVYTVCPDFLLVCVKVAGSHVNEIHDFCKQLNISRLGCLCRRHFALRFACLPIDIEHGKFYRRVLLATTEL